MKREIIMGGGPRSVVNIFKESGSVYAHSTQEKERERKGDA